MTITLFLDLKNLDYYGDIPELPNNLEGRVETYHLSAEENEWLVDDSMSINEKCNTLLDYGDIDFFDGKKCELLIEWIDKRETENISNNYKELLQNLKEYCQRAIDLKTGIVIEL